MSWSKCMTCIFLWSVFWLSNTCDASMPTFHAYPKLHSRALVVGYENKAKNSKIPLVRYHTLWASKRIIRGTYISLQKLIKPPDRWLIKEWMIGDSVITILSCNRPRTWKSFTPHTDQGKGWIKCQLIWIAKEYFVIGMALMNCISIVATPDQQLST
jgi:hypothetical protein